MRRLSSVLPIIVLNACIGVTVHVPGGGSKDPVTVGARVGAGPFGVTVFTIRTRLKRVRDDIPARRAQLHPISCGTEVCYSLDEVRDGIAKIRADAGMAFPRQALASRLTLDEELAGVEDRLAVARQPSSIYLIRNAQDRSERLVSARAADAAFDRAKEPIDTYLGHQELNPTLHIRSEPDGAEFRMLIGTNRKTMRHVWTQDDLQSVWRGKYTGTVTKRGFRDATGFDVDLFHSNGTTVRCTLVPNDAPGDGQSICRLGD